MRDLDAIRQDFDAVDQELCRLFEKRIDLAKETAHLKYSRNLPIYDPVREKQIIERQKERFQGHDEFFLKELERLYELLFMLSREEQQRIFDQYANKEETALKDITIYTDGACSGNPGPGGYGCILMARGANGEMVKKELSGGFSTGWRSWRSSWPWSSSKNRAVLPFIPIPNMS